MEKDTEPKRLSISVDRDLWLWLRTKALHEDSNATELVVKLLRDARATENDGK